MNALLDLQQHFKDTLLIKDNTIEQYLHNNNESKAYSAIEIYKNAYQIRLMESLKVDYPMLEKLLGTDAFKGLAIEYINEYPSSSFTLRFFGQYLSDFLKKDVVYQKQSYLAEMAEFEWNLADVFDVADKKPATVNDMSHFKAEDWPHLTVKYHPSVRWVILHWNIVDVYQALLSNSSVPDLEYFSKAKQCLIWRKHYSSFFRMVSTNEWMAMKIIEQSNFSELCETLSALEASNEKSALTAATYLKTWLSTDLIDSVETVNQEI